jgi:RNA polymerase sigma-70 factor (ECF subfamily)
MVDREIESRFSAIYGKEADALFRYVLLRVSDREEALDITSGVFGKLWELLTAGEKIRDHRAFIFTVARNRVIDWYRKRRPISLDKLMEPDENEDGPAFQVPDDSADGKIEAFSEGKLVLEALSKVPRSLGDTLYLRFVEGLEIEEIGKIMGITSNAVSIRINRGIEELKKILRIEK